MLRQLLNVHLLTADTYGTQESQVNLHLEVDRDPKIQWRILDPHDGPEVEQKARYVTGLNPTNAVAVGNGLTIVDAEGVAPPLASQSFSDPA